MMYPIVKYVVLGCLSGLMSMFFDMKCPLYRLTAVTGILILAVSFFSLLRYVPKRKDWLSPSGAWIVYFCAASVSASCYGGHLEHVHEEQRRWPSANAQIVDAVRKEEKGRSHRGGEHHRLVSRYTYAYQVGDIDYSGRFVEIEDLLRTPPGKRNIRYVKDSLTVFYDPSNPSVSTACISSGGRAELIFATFLLAAAVVTLLANVLSIAIRRMS